jgi:NADH-quinone oxidoreductase subunit M
MLKQTSNIRASPCEVVAEYARELAEMGGLWDTIPRMSGAGMFFALGSLGLPGLGDFVGEFLVLLGVWRAWPAIAVVASVGILTATFYALKLVQDAFQGPNVHRWSLQDLTGREWAIMGSMIMVLIWLGIYPQPVLSTFAPAMRMLQGMAGF